MDVDRAESKRHVCVALCALCFPVEFHPQRFKFYMAAVMSLCSFTLGAYLLIVDHSGTLGATLVTAAIALWVQPPSMPEEEAAPSHASVQEV